jgi:hypothetical protein
MLGRISLGSLVYVILLRTAMANFGQLRDLYLPTNTLAALANLAPQASALHPHAAQRLLGLASVLGRRYIKVARKLDALAAGTPPASGGGGGGGGGAARAAPPPAAAAAAGSGSGGDGKPGSAPAQQAAEELRERLAQDEEVRPSGSRPRGRALVAHAF